MLSDAGTIRGFPKIGKQIFGVYGPCQYVQMFAYYFALKI